MATSIKTCVSVQVVKVQLKEKQPANYDAMWSLGEAEMFLDIWGEENESISHKLNQ